jgi:hypothetical protein
MPSGYLLESPDTVLTKTCIVSSASEPMELMLEMESERRIMMAVVVRCAACGGVCGDGDDAGVAVDGVEIAEIAPVAVESGVRQWRRCRVLRWKWARCWQREGERSEGCVVV